MDSAGGLRGGALPHLGLRAGSLPCPRQRRAEGPEPAQMQSLKLGKRLRDPHPIQLLPQRSFPGMGEWGVPCIGFLLTVGRLRKCPRLGQAPGFASGRCAPEDIGVPGGRPTGCWVGNYSEKVRTWHVKRRASL